MGLTQEAQSSFVGSEAPLNQNTAVLTVQVGSKSYPMAELKEVEPISYNDEGVPSGGKIVMTPNPEALKKDPEHGQEKLDEYMDKVRAEGYQVEKNPDGTYTFKNTELSAEKVSSGGKITVVVQTLSHDGEGTLMSGGNFPDYKGMPITLRPVLDDGKGKPVLNSKGEPMIAPEALGSNTSAINKAAPPSSPQIPSSQASFVM